MRRPIVATLLIGMTAACQPPADTQATNTANESANAANAAAAENAVGANESDNGAEPVRSILRPDVVEEKQPPKIEPETAVIGFGVLSMKLDDAAKAALDAIVKTPAMTGGGAVTLRGHSDSRGHDGDNKAASRIRAELVRDYLVEQGIAADRINLIAIGEGRPIAPNVKEDGSDDPDGQAKNRRVEVLVAAPPLVEAPPPVTMTTPEQ